MWFVMSFFSSLSQRDSVIHLNISHNPTDTNIIYIIDYMKLEYKDIVIYDFQEEDIISIHLKGNTLTARTKYCYLFNDSLIVTN